MIFIALGTHELPFTRLLDELERLKKSNEINEEIIVQSGHTDFKSDYMKIVPFVSYEEMDELYDNASLIICHAGTGSIISGLKKGKKVIVAARLKKYGEHNDNHQLEITKIFTENDYILEWGEDNELLDVIEQAESFQTKPFVSKKNQLLTLLRDFIDTN